MAGLAKSGGAEANAAVYALSRHWKDDDATRQLMAGLAKSGGAGAEAAAYALAEHWKDDDATRQLMVDVAKSGGAGACTAIHALSRHWKDDDATRQLMAGLAKSGGAGAEAAVYALAEHWKDDDATRQLMAGLAKSGGAEANAAVYALSRHWKDDDATRQLMAGLAKSGGAGAEAAAYALAEHWKDDDATRQLMVDVAKSGGAGACTAIHALSRHWKDDDATRQLMAGLAKSGGAEANAAVYALSRHWKDDDATRQLMAGLAKSGGAGAEAAAYALAEHWKDDDATRQLMVDVAKSGGAGAEAAAYALAEHWKDDDATRQLMAGLAKSGGAEADAAVYARSGWDKGRIPQLFNSSISQEVALPSSSFSSQGDYEMEIDGLDTDEDDSPPSAGFEAECIELVEANRQCFQAWVRLHGSKLSEEEGLWLVFQHGQVEPQKRATTLKEAWNGVLGVAYVGHAKDDLDTGRLAVACVAVSYPSAAGFDLVHDVSVDIRPVPGAPSQRQMVRGQYVAQRRRVPRRFTIDPQLPELMRVPVMVDTGATYVHMREVVVRPLDLINVGFVHFTPADGQVQRQPAHSGEVRVDNRWYRVQIVMSGVEMLGRAVLNNMHMQWPAGGLCELTDTPLGGLS